VPKLSYADGRHHEPGGPFMPTALKRWPHRCAAEEAQEGAIEKEEEE
jgi:hypothetical protein